MELKVAERKQAKIKMALQGPSGSGKTMGALLIAYGLCGDWAKIAVIDTENHSASLYAHLGEFNVVSIAAPFSPEKYMEAIKLCVSAGIEIVIIDSISHEWEGSGGILDIHGSMAGNSFTNWAKVTPRHNNFVQEMLQSPVHIIGTIRSKQDYVLHEKNGKQVPEKVGLKGVTRNGMDYEMTVVLDVDIRHNAIASKDRTNLFMDKPEFKITTDTGKRILDWCNMGVMDSCMKKTSPPSEQEGFDIKIKSCKTLGELGKLYVSYPQYQQTHNEQFVKRKQQLQPVAATNLSTPNISANGNGSIQ